MLSQYVMKRGFEIVKYDKVVHCVCYPRLFLMEGKNAIMYAMEGQENFNLLSFMVMLYNTKGSEPNNTYGSEIYF